MTSSNRRWRQPCAVAAASLAMLAATTLPLQAQTAARSARADPLDPAASVPAAGYRSSLPSPRATADEKPVSWREANDTVARIGGWRVYAREAQQADPAATSAPVPPAAAKPAAPAPATPPPAPAPSPAGHTGHRSP